MATELEQFLARKPIDLKASIDELKLHVLNEGVPTASDGGGKTRPTIWSILLAVPPLETDRYLDYLDRGPSSAYQKIRNDTFRTLPSDHLFKNRVNELSLIRLLNSFAWSQVDARANLGRSNSTNHADCTYVQGMNVLAAPFLYACDSEVEAFALYRAWITQDIPLYVTPSLDGVHMGVKLLDQCLERLDSKLFNHLRTKGLSAELYAFPSVMTLSACTPPLSEALVLWDFLIAYGPHMNILCVIAQLIMMREQLMAAASPMSLLRKFPPLKGARVKQLAISFVPAVGKDLYDLLARHCWDGSLARQMLS